MNYLCLCYYNEDRHPADAASTSEVIDDATRAYVDELLERGDLHFATKRRKIQGTMTLCIRQNGLHVSDEPPDADGERLEAVLVIEARDLNDALRIASESPLAKVGTIRVMPVEDLRTSLPARDRQTRQPRSHPGRDT